MKKTYDTFCCPLLWLEQKLLFTFMEPTFYCPLLWLKQKLPFTFMEPKVKYMCINRPLTSKSRLFHHLSTSQVSSNSNFVQIQFLSIS